ncbi:MAG: hypothetical protein AAB362_00580 [Patescibacteria group bacterium]
MRCITTAEFRFQSFVIFLESQDDTVLIYDINRHFKTTKTNLNVASVKEFFRRKNIALN